MTRNRTESKEKNPATKEKDGNTRPGKRALHRGTSRTGRVDSKKVQTGETGVNRGYARNQGHLTCFKVHEKRRVGVLMAAGGV